jgi:hypothetical protein
MVSVWDELAATLAFIDVEKMSDFLMVKTCMPMERPLLWTDDHAWDDYFLSSIRYIWNYVCDQPLVFLR